MAQPNDDIMKLKQEIFAKAAAGLASQNWERSLSCNICSYRGPLGLKCAIGHLIPDDRYSADIENKTVFHKVVAEAIPELDRFAGTVPLALAQFLRDLQHAHDFSISPFGLHQKFKEIAFLIDFPFDFPAPVN